MPLSNASLPPPTSISTNLYQKQRNVRCRADEMSWLHVIPDESFSGPKVKCEHGIKYSTPVLSRLESKICVPSICLASQLSLTQRSTKNKEILRCRTDKVLRRTWPRIKVSPVRGCIKRNAGTPKGSGHVDTGRIQCELARFYAQGAKYFPRQGQSCKPIKRNTPRRSLPDPTAKPAMSCR